MPQMALMFDPALMGFDLVFAGGEAVPDYVGDEGWVTAVNISLFTDRRAPESELETSPHGQLEEPRGWWGDWLGQADDQLDEIGSRLWLLERAKDTQETLNRARRYAEEALAWLTTPAAGALRVQKLAVSAERAGEGLFALTISVSREDEAGQLLTPAWRYIYNYQSGEYYAVEPTEP